MGAAVINCWQPAVITDVCSDSLGLSLWAGEMKQLIVFSPPVCHQSQRNHLIWSRNSAPSKWILASAYTSEHFLLTVRGEMVTHLTLLSLFQRSYFPLLSWNKMKLDNNNEFLFTFCCCIWWHFDSICVSLWVTHIKEQIFSFHLSESRITVQRLISNYWHLLSEQLESEKMRKIVVSLYALATCASFCTSTLAGWKIIPSQKTLWITQCG